MKTKIGFLLSLQRKALAKDIYSRHLATRASEPVNVDGTARAYTERFVDAPTAIMFDVPQNQVQRLVGNIN